jgi:hypothetical protein
LSISGTNIRASTNSHAEFVKPDTNKDSYLENTEVRSDIEVEQDFSKLVKSGPLSESEFPPGKANTSPSTTPEVL